MILKYNYGAVWFSSEDPNKNIHAFLASRNWTNAESYTAPEQSRKKRGDPETPKIYSMRSACSIFFDVPLGLNPQLDDFQGKPIVKMVSNKHTTDKKKNLFSGKNYKQVHYKRYHKCSVWFSEVNKNYSKFFKLKKSNTKTE